MKFSQLKTAGVYPAATFVVTSAKTAAAFNTISPQPMAPPSGQMWFMDPIFGSGSITGGFGLRLINRYVEGVGTVSTKYVLWIDYRNDPKMHPFSGIIERNFGRDTDFKSADKSVCWVKTYEGMKKAILQYGMPLGVYINNIRPEEEKGEMDCLMYLIAIMKKYRQVRMPQIFSKCSNKNIKESVEAAISAWTEFLHNKLQGI